MVTLTFASALSSSSSSTLLSLKPPLTPPPSVSSTSLLKLKPFKRKKIKSGICRAELSQDAPLAVAIGACMLSSLLLPNSVASVDEDSDSGLDSTDARLAAMGIISFIPYFNWLSWVFAWLDTGKRRYVVYSIAYLAPYLRSNFSLSPEESWLPIASIVLGIFHVQLEASIKNGDFREFQLFKPMMKEEDANLKGQRHRGPSRKGRKKEHQNLPSAEEQSRSEIQEWGLPRNPSKHDEHSNGDWEDDEKRKQ